MKDNPRKGSILAVDDTPANLRLLSEMLNSTGHKVRPSPNGRLALQAAKNDPPDLILLDINMPEMNGFEVCRALKTDDTLKDIPVLFISALSDTEDKVTAFQAGGLDYITKPFQAEEVLARVETHLQIRHYQKALKDKNEILERTLSELKDTQNHLVQSEKMASLGILTAGVAHEMNNPINFIKSSAHALNLDMDDIMRLLKAHEDCSATCPDTLVREQLVRIKKEIDYEVLISELTALVAKIILGVNRTEEIINSLRTYARKDNGKKSLTDLNELIDMALVLLKSRYHKTVTITKDYGYLPPIPVQPGRLSQVLSNVISNSIDAVTEDRQDTQPAIDITTGLEVFDNLTYAVVRISDNGSGINHEHIDKIFDPFYTTKKVGKGTGLGMSISYGIIRDHKGRITVNRSDKRGTIVTIILPVKEAGSCQITTQ